MSRIALMGLLLAALPLLAAPLDYQTPPPQVAELLDAPPSPILRLSPQRDRMLILERPPLLDIAQLAQPELRLAGLRINPRTGGPSRERPYRNARLRELSGGREMPFRGLPADAKIFDPLWSPDGAHLAITLEFADRLELWLVDAESAEARAMDCPPLNAAFGRPYQWMPDGRALVARCVPPERGAAPQAPQVPSGPFVQENLGGKRPARTHQDLLENPGDEALFVYHALSRLRLVPLDGPSRPLGPPDLIAEFDPSPDGTKLLVERLHKPFSYSQPYQRFPLRTEVWNLEANVVAEIADLPLAENVPMAFGSVREGRRVIAWRADADAALYCVEALDGGDARNEADTRDLVSLLDFPYKGEGRPLARLALRFSGIQWGHGELALLSEDWWKTRRIRTWRLRPDLSEAEPELLVDRSREDRYADPGSPLMHRNERGRSVLLSGTKGESLYLVGDGASPEGDRPFLDRLDLSSGKTERLFHSQAPWYERPVDLLDSDKLVLLTQRESLDSPPNWCIRDLKRDRLKTVTDFPHPTPQLRGLAKELIHYTREDGVELSGTLYLPPGYDRERDGALPLILWAYPREYKDADAAGQVSGSPHRFVRVSWASPLVHLLEGYAVLDGPAMPIVGAGDQEPNDRFVEQLVASAKAAIDAVAARGVGDPERVAVGGHSYGAFMTANLLAHSDLFRAGIARSGAYNRSLTPFGFQSEERSLWQAPEVYFDMSPFMHADTIDEPLLLIHGEEDDNSGTYPLQSERFYGALMGHGAVARLVILPHESHSYRARESVMHMLWEQSRWLDRHVKDAR